MILCLEGVLVMKKNSFITFAITLVIVSIIILLNYIGIKNDSTLTCNRGDKSKIIFIFNEAGIVKMTKDGKLVSDQEMSLYNVAMSSSFAWNKMSGTYSEIVKRVKRHMSDVAEYEKYMYDSYCNFEQ